jgi:hypothetical protein
MYTFWVFFDTCTKPMKCEGATLESVRAVWDNLNRTGLYRLSARP